MRSLLLPLLIGFPLYATAEPVEVSESVDITAPASEVWEVVKQFNDLHSWHPAVASTDIVEGENNVVGAVRKLTLGDGGVIIETLTVHDEDAMSFTYTMGETVLPVADYSSSVTVSGDDSSAQVLWSGRFEPTTEDSAAVMSSVYRGGLDTLKSQIEAK